MMPKEWRGWKWLAPAWLVFISILFLLPGSALPKENWLTAIHFDKIVHVVFFAVLAFLWRFHIKENGFLPLLLLLALALVYGLLVELVQKAYVANRDADFWDVAADMAGAVLGVFLWGRMYETSLNEGSGYKKNKPL